MRDLTEAFFRDELFIKLRYKSNDYFNQNYFFEITHNKYGTFRISHQEILKIRFKKSDIIKILGLWHGCIINIRKRGGKGKITRVREIKNCIKKTMENPNYFIANNILNEIKKAQNGQ